MALLACINVPYLDLQIIVRRHPRWRSLPAAVVTEEKPLGRIVSTNKLSRAAGVRTGMRYASALGICPHLRVEPVSDEARSEIADRVVEVLHRFSPQIEASTADPALFWANAAGMERLYASPAKWAGSLETALGRLDLLCAVAVGFTRFGTYAAAKRRTGVTVLADADQEQAIAMRAPVSVLPLDHQVLERCTQLGVSTMRDFVRFSPGSLRRRFGARVEALQRFARGEAELPLQPVAHAIPLRFVRRLSYAERTTNGVLHHLFELLAELFTVAVDRVSVVAEVTVELHLEDESVCSESIRSARPTSDQALYRTLLRLRIEAAEPAQPVRAVALSARLVSTQQEQGDLFVDAPKRDPAAAMASVALVQAELGTDAVQTAVLVDHHLPEKQFAWRTVTSLVAPAMSAAPAAQLVRRILTQPIDYALQEAGATVSAVHRVTGAWWARPVAREYRYVRTPAGRLLWGYIDFDTNEWRVQGAVE